MNVPRCVFKGANVNFQVLSRELIRTVTGDEPYIVISITNPDLDQAVIAESPFCLGVLHLQFWDSDFNDAEMPSITDAEALLLLRFVEQHPSAKLIITQCEAGLSRSAGAAAALSSILNNTDQWACMNFWPNAKVRSTILGVYRTEFETQSAPLKVLGRTIAS